MCPIALMAIVLHIAVTTQMKAIIILFDVYRFELDFNESDLKLQEEETMGYRLVTLDEIKELDKQGIFLHYSSIKDVFE